MLVLSRKVGETIVIGDHRVTVIANVGGKVKLGVQAPRDVAVHRLEVYQRIAEAGQSEPIGKGAA